MKFNLWPELRNVSGAKRSNYAYSHGYGWLLTTTRGSLALASDPSLHAARFAELRSGGPFGPAWQRASNAHEGDRGSTVLRHPA